ncbi:MAG TPA: hypothetical protein VJZ17_01910 [Nitrosopumilaceae archaeon]|nr:hypothetical protein [Nitrosopumilaceae archaeon]
MKYLKEIPKNAIPDIADDFNKKLFGEKASYKNSSFFTDTNLVDATNKPFGKGLEKKLKKSRELL